MEEWLDQLWDERYWSIALKSDKAMETYHEMKESIQQATDSVKIDELPQADREWLRRTS
jgi:hypothetical protein